MNSVTYYMEEKQGTDWGFPTGERGHSDCPQAAAQTLTVEAASARQTQGSRLRVHPELLSGHFGLAARLHQPFREEQPQ